jgi:predicted SprT family Zn-dependent metalloprotease
MLYMQTTTASRMAREMMNEHGLGHWSFEFDRSVYRFGVCRHGRQTIGLSEKLVRLNDEAQVRNTLLHEIAHALVGPGHGHDSVWQRKARAIGCDGQRCYSSTDVAPVPAPWVGTCPGCGVKAYRHRLTQKGRMLACGRCCRGRWCAAYQFVWVRQQVSVAA